MNNMVRVCTVVASLTLAATFVGWRVHAARSRPNVQIEIVKDPSRSTTDGCETVIGLAEDALGSDGLSVKSTLTVLLLGDAASAYEPTVLGSYLIPFSTKVIEGRGANRQRQAGLLKDLFLKCRAAHATDISPIFLAVKQAIADLRGKGCNTSSRCRLDVDSDLEDNVELGIKNRLNNTNGNKHPLPGLIDNSNIAISFCGLAATTGRVFDSSGRAIHKFAMRDPAREDRLKSTWRSLFSAPDLVTFQPYCPVATDVAQYNAGEDPPLHK
jgi:hypothetical protein